VMKVKTDVSAGSFFAISNSRFVYEPEPEP
jgi:hypothetical protein